MAISDNLPSKQIPCLDHLEIVTVLVSFAEMDVTFCMVYAPLNVTADYHKDISNYLTSTASLSTPVFILDDFNLPDINWATLTGSTLISNYSCEYIFKSNLSRLVESPTHKHSNVLVIR